jgi:hypothetical protein
MAGQRNDECRCCNRTGKEGSAPAPVGGRWRQDAADDARYSGDPAMKRHEQHGG